MFQPSPLSYSFSIDKVEKERLKMKDTRKYHEDDYDQFLNELTNGNIVRIGKFVNSTTPILHHCNKHDVDFYPRPAAFINKGQIGCRRCSIKRSRKTQEEFETDVKDINSNISVIGVYKGSAISTKLKCNICGYEWQAKLDRIKKHKGCPACSGVAIQKGLNDLWTKNPEMAKLLKNPEDGYKLGEWSRIPTDWICPYCGKEIKDRPPKQVKSNGLNCNNCSESLSYPEKFFREFLKYMNIDFKSQKIFDWAKNKKYDFYFDGIICETHGLQHYEKSWTSVWKRDLETEQENDRFKKL